MQETSSNYSTYHLIKVFILTTIVISIIGYIDYITGVISLDILYLVCLGVAVWYTNTFLGILFVIEIMLARTLADYYDHIKIGSRSYEYYLLNYLLMYFIACILVGRLKKMLSD